jgi:hypothetical protein
MLIFQAEKVVIDEIRIIEFSLGGIATIQKFSRKAAKAQRVYQFVTRS